MERRHVHGNGSRRRAATGADLTTDEALDAIADNFLRWTDGGPADIGIQTRAVLSATRRRLSGGGLGAIMRDEANAYAEQHPHWPATVP